MPGPNLDNDILDIEPGSDTIMGPLWSRYECILHVRGIQIVTARGFTVADETFHIYGYTYIYIYFYMPSLQCD